MLSGNFKLTFPAFITGFRVAKKIVKKHYFLKAFDILLFLRATKHDLT